MSAKIEERIPLKYCLVRFASSVAPASLLKGGTVNEHYFVGLVESFYKSQNILSTVADMVKMQYSALCKWAQTELKPTFENFMATTIRLDEFYFKLLDNQPEYAEIWHVIKLILVLSHGNVAVESGFCVNGDMLVENLHKASLIV